MSQAPAPPRSRSGPSGRQRGILATLAVLAALALLWTLYLLAANLALRSEAVRQRINRRPEKLQVAWNSAWTWWPGRVRLQDLSIRGQSRHARWSAELDHLVLDADLLALPGRTFHVTRARGRGMVFRYLRPAAPGEILEDPDQAPIPPLAAGPATEPVTRPRRGRWTLLFEGIDLDSVRQVWINRFRVDGDGQAGGTFSLTPGGGPLSVRGGFLRWPRSDLVSGREVISRDFALSAQLDLDPMVPRQTHGRAILAHLSGELRITGEVDSLAFLHPLTAEVPNLELEGGGSLDTRLRLSHGRLLEGSRLAVDHAHLAAEVLGIRVGGAGAITGEVEDQDGGRTLSLRVSLTEMELAPASIGGASWTAPGLQVEIRTASPDLSQGFPDPVLHLDLPRLHLTDMRSWNPFLPTGLGLAFTGGDADLAIHLDASMSSARGRLAISSKRLGVAWKGRRGSADLEADLRVVQGDPRARWLDFTGSRIRLSKLRLGDDRPGPELPASASLEVTSGNLIAPEPAAAGIDAEDPPGDAGARHFSSTGARHLSGGADDGALGAESKVDPIPRPVPSPLTGLDRASGHLTFSGRLSDLGVLDHVLPTASWLRLGGELDLRSEIVLVDGELAPETSARFRAPRLQAVFADFAARGRGTVWASLGRDGGGSQVTLSLRQAELRRRGDPLPLLRTPNLDLVATGPPTGAADPFTGRVRADLPATAEIDLVRLRELLPPELPFELRGGRATVGAHFDLTGGSGSGQLRVDARGLAATLRDHPISGDLGLRLELAHGDLNERTFDLTGSRIDLDGWVAGDQDPSTGLDANLEVRAGLLTWSEGDGGAPGVRVPPGTLTLEGRISDLGFFDPFFDVGSWLHLEGEAEVRSELQLDEKGLAAGSNLEVTADRLVASFVGYRARGVGVVRGRLLNPPPKPRSQLDLALEDVAIFRQGDQTPYVYSPSLVLEAIGGDLSHEGLLADLEIQAQLAPADLPDLTSLNVYLPPGGAVELTSGKGRLGGWISLSAGRGDGRLELTAERLEARIHGFDLSTDLRLEVPLTTHDPTAWTFDLDGARLRLEHTTVLGQRPDDEGWWAELELPRASVRQIRPLELAGDFNLSMRDTRPLTELLAEEKKILRWFDSLLTVRDVGGSGRVGMGSDGFHLAPLVVTGRHFELRARLHFLEGLEEGLFYVRFHKLSAGVEVKDDRRDLKLLNAREWYERRAGLAVPPDP